MILISTSNGLLPDESNSITIFIFKISRVQSQDIYGKGSFHSIKKHILDAVRLLEKDQPYQEYHQHIKGPHKEFNIVEKTILQAAKRLEDKGYTKEQMISKIKRECKLADCEQAAIDFIDDFLRSQYKE